MDGPPIVAHSLSWPGNPDKYGNMWQYHSRSDRHAKVLAWALLYDLLASCEALNAHAAEMRVGLGLKQRMRDPRTASAKNIDIVLGATTAEEVSRARINLRDLAVRWSIRLGEEQRQALDRLPALCVVPVSRVLIAIEAKACMTAHIRAVPRFIDELASSHMAIHAEDQRALAAGLALVNVSGAFLSPDRNKHDLTQFHAVLSQDPQPKSAEKALEAIRRLPIRDASHDFGYDALGAITICMRNDGSAVRLHQESPAPASAELIQYEQMVHRLARLYEAAFAA